MCSTIIGFLVHVSLYGYYPHAVVFVHLQFCSHHLWMFMIVMAANWAGRLTKTSKHSIFLLFCFSATFQYDFFCMRVFPTITDRVYYLSQLRWHHWFPDIRWHGRAKTFSVAYCTGGSKIPNRPHKMHFINNCAILFLPKLSDLYGRDPVTVLNFSK